MPLTFSLSQIIRAGTIHGWGEFIIKLIILNHIQNFKAFKELFVSVVSLLNPNGSEEVYGQAADDLIALETSLAQVRDSVDSAE
jgi:hypothetical protein